MVTEKKCDKKEFLNTPRIFSKLKILFKAECKLKAEFILPLYFHLEAVKKKLKLNCQLKWEFRIVDNFAK